MKLTYEKPVIELIPDYAEGIYAASGVNGGGTATLSNRRVQDRWPNGGTVAYSVNLSGLNASNLTVSITYNSNVRAGWADGGASTSISGNVLTLTWYSAPESAVVYTQPEAYDIDAFEAISVSSGN